MNIFLLLLFWYLWFLTFCARTVLSPLLPIIEDELTIGHALAASFFTFVAAGYTTTLVLSGILSPRIGHKRAIIAGFVIVMAGLFCLKYATTYSLLAIGSLLIGLGTGIYLPNALPLLTATFARENWGKAIAFHDTAASVGVLSVPLMATVTLRFFHWRGLFTIVSGAYLLAIIAFWVFGPELQPREEKRARFLSILRRKDLWIMMSLWVIASALSLGLYNLIPLFLVAEKGMDLQVANTIFGISRGGGLCAVFLVGFLVDRYGVKKLLALLLLNTGLATIGLALAEAFPVLVTMLVLQAAFGTAFFAVGLMIISKLTDFEERGIFVGTTVATGVIIGHGFFSVVLGAVADTWNFQIGILVLGILAALSCLLLTRLREV